VSTQRGGRKIFEEKYLKSMNKNNMWERLNIRLKN
jgi:hypothetical protein